MSDGYFIDLRDAIDRTSMEGDRCRTAKFAARNALRDESFMRQRDATVLQEPY